MEFVRGNSTGKLKTHFIDSETGTVHKVDILLKLKWQLSSHWQHALLLKKISLTITKLEQQKQLQQQLS